MSYCWYKASNGWAKFFPRPSLQWLIFNVPVDEREMTCCTERCEMFFGNSVEKSSGCGNKNSWVATKIIYPRLMSPCLSSQQNIIRQVIYKYNTAIETLAFFHLLIFNQIFKDKSYKMDYSLEIHVLQNTGFLTCQFLPYMKMRSMHASVFLPDNQNIFGRKTSYFHTFYRGLCWIFITFTISRGFSTLSWNARWTCHSPCLLLTL